MSYKSEFTPSPVQSKALFVVAQIGQTKQAQALAKHLGLTNFDIAILYTKKNLEMPRLMEADIDILHVTGIHKTEIHPASNELSSDAVNFDRIAYIKLLDNVRPQRLYVCSFERHYAILCGEAKKRGIAISLFEEGTAILKMTVPGYQSFPPITLERSANTIYRRVWKDQPITKYVISPLIGAVLQLIDLPRLIWRTGVEIYKTPQVQTRLLVGKESAFLSGWNQFEEVYSSHPTVVSEFFPGAIPKEFHPDHSKPEDTAVALQLIAEFGIDHNTAIFASQRFDLQAERQIPIVLAILAEVVAWSGYKIAIKLHPRESGKVVEIYRKSIELLDNEGKITLIEGAHIPAEALIANSASPAVIGISSSTLMYAPHAKPGVRTISIGQQLLKDFQRLRIANPGTRQIRDHVQILNALKHIEHFDVDAARLITAKSKNDADVLDIDPKVMPATSEMPSDVKLQEMVSREEGL